MISCGQFERLDWDFNHPCLKEPLIDYLQNYTAVCLSILVLSIVRANTSSQYGVSG